MPVTPDLFPDTSKMLQPQMRSQAGKCRAGSNRPGGSVFAWQGARCLSLLFGSCCSSPYGSHTVLRKGTEHNRKVNSKGEENRRSDLLARLT